ncbi:MAG TPA: AMP-binding protein [Acidimicrobiia bacterium]|nr:AMP-binding protein [Acidimicrobiia bacterium]
MSIGTIADVLRAHRRTRPDAVAVIDDDVRFTWAALDDRVDRVAHGLRSCGVGPGDRVLWLGQNSYRIQELLLACAKLGAVLCPANWRQQTAELAFVIDDLAPRVVVWQEHEIGATVRAARSASAAADSARWFRHDGPPDDPDGYESLLAGQPGTDPDADGDADTPVLAIYTAAFVGHPNAALLPHRALVAQGALMAPWQDIDDSYVFLNSGPLFHIGTFMPNLSTFVAGGTNVFVPRSDGEVLCRAIAEHRCTGGFVVGPMVDAIVAANADRRYDLSSFRGRRGHPEFDAMVQPDRSAWGRRPGGYGQTEVMGMATFNLLAPDGIGAHGGVSPLVELRVVDLDGDDVAPGDVGEIAIRGATVMRGYWNRPELDRARRRGGWHLTNDLGRYESDGTFTFVGPKSRMLKSGAENIYPAEVEACLRAHPAVADCAVIGAPDATWVQHVVAIVVRRDGTSVTDAELIEHCRTRIASYKKPRRVEFVDVLPRVGSAVDYDELDRHFGGGGYPGGATRSV